ncbi:DUF6182 family protein [Streptomyces sp. NPDC005970]|uniref:DUF6182 family protein n=1 Tax=Streptomyces sp. NPDC005970 TaxID=3156723 RepID=UPI0033DD93B3
MKLSQDLLRAEAARRVRVARPDLAADLDLSTAAALSRVHARIQESADTDTDALLAVSVVRRFELAEWTRATCEFAIGLAPERLAAWRRSFSRTIFLAGNPDNLGDRVRFDHIAEDGSAAWTGPAPAGASAGLRRLLKLFDGSHGLPARPDTAVRIPEAIGPRHRPPVRRELYVATAGTSVADCLVHLNHLLVEAVLDGLIAPGDTLVVRQVPRLVGLSGPYAALRVGAEREHPDRLRAYACLTEETVAVGTG